MSSKKKQTGKNSEYKTLTSGNVAILDWVSDETHGEEEDEDDVLEETGQEAMGSSWTARQWLEEGKGFLDPPRETRSASADLLGALLD